jgi:Immunoglobulin V-set domain
VGQDVIVSSPPRNVTAQTGSFAYLNCEVNSQYSDAFAWRFLGSSTGGDLIYMSPPYKSYNKFPPNRFHKVGDFGLNITSLQWQDGGTYDCTFLSGDAHGIADVIVIGKYIFSPTHVNVLLIYTC